MLSVSYLGSLIILESLGDAYALLLILIFDLIVQGYLRWKGDARENMANFICVLTEERTTSKRFGSSNSAELYSEELYTALRVLRIRRRFGAFST